MAEAHLALTNKTKQRFEQIRVDLMKQRDSHKKPTQNDALEHLIQAYRND